MERLNRPRGLSMLKVDPERLFTTLWGGHETLPMSEVEHTLRAEGYGYRVVERLPQVLRFEADPSCSKPLAERLGMAREVCLELLSCRDDREEILSRARELELPDWVRGESFVVRVQRVRGSSRHLRALDLEREVGGALWLRTGLKVDLWNPDLTLRGVLTGGRFLLGLVLSTLDRRALESRRVKMRPFKHPTSLHPVLARCMVNLSEARRGEVVLDPFCGSGGIMLEAGLMGCVAVGVDVRWDMAEGCIRNLRHYGVRDFHILVGDARKTPITEADRAVTDPPYGRGATTMGVGVEELLRNALNRVSEILKPDGAVCTAYPEPVDIVELASDVGFRVVEKHSVYVHRSLTRGIAVLVKA